MGVKGLWKLLDGTGRPVNLESLEGKILAVDISVWLNMAIKGMRDYHGHASATAHLITLFNRICKLMYYGVKPVFVFDGQAPMLKQRTLRERREQKHHHTNESKKANEKILQNYLKKQILEEAVGKSSQDDKAGTSKSLDKSPSTSNRTKVKPQEKDIFDLPPLASRLDDSDQDDLEEELKMRAELQNEYLDEAGHLDIASVMDMNIDSKDFAALPSDIQYELLKDLKEIRKRRRTRIEAMPEESNSFSEYQLAGLLAKRKISKKMEQMENKMSEENVAASTQQSGFTGNLSGDHIVEARQLVSDSTSHYIWMRKQNSKENEKNTYEELPVVEISETKALPSIPEENGNGESNPEQVVGIPETKTLHAIPEEEESSSDQEQEALPPSQKAEAHILSLANKDTPRHTDLTIPRAFEDRPDNQSHRTTISPEDNRPDKIIISSGDDHDISFKSGNLNGKVAISEALEDKNSNDEHFEVSSIQKNIELEIVAQPEPVGIVQQIDTKTVEVKDVNSNSIIEPMLEKNIEIDLKETPTVMKTDAFSVKPLENKVVYDNDESSDEDFIDVSEQQYNNVVPGVAITQTAESVEDAITNTKKPEEEVKLIDHNPWEGLNVENVETFASQLDAESRELQQLMQAKERAARDLSHSAVMECQELLKLFGLPYIVSPQEAEAQCAALELLGLTHGTVTEDSDIWLFGGRYVIKDMFGSNSNPTAFNASDIEMQLGLSRDRFICVALCTGSDYTTGIRGVGPVTAMEILKEFDGNGIEGLVKLRQWWDEVCSSTKVRAPTETKIKSQLRRVNLKKDFPSEAVYKAYIQPIVDETNKMFEWGFPDLDELRNFAVHTMGWTRQKVDEVLLPLMKKLGQQRSSQTRITQFLPSVTHVTNKKKSKRVLRAAAVLTGKNDLPDESSAKKKPRRTAKGKKTVEIKKEERIQLSESSSDD